MLYTLCDITAEAIKCKQDKHTYPKAADLVIFSSEELLTCVSADTATGQCPAYFEKSKERND